MSIKITSNMFKSKTVQKHNVQSWDKMIKSSKSDYNSSLSGVINTSKGTTNKHSKFGTIRVKAEWTNKTHCRITSSFKGPESWMNELQGWRNKYSRDRIPKDSNTFDSCILNCRTISTEQPMGIKTRNRPIEKLSIKG